MPSKLPPPKANVDNVLPELIEAARAQRQQDAADRSQREDPVAGTRSRSLQWLLAVAAVAAILLAIHLLG